MIPKINREWWEQKLAGTVERDVRKDAELEALGSVVIHVWEHEDPDVVSTAIVKQWRERTGRAA